MLAGMDITPFLTDAIAESLLYPEQPHVFVSTEQERMWSRRWASALRNLFPGSVLDKLWDRPLMRTFDVISGSNPTPEPRRMLARDPRMRLDNKEIRVKTLKIHANHKDWQNTPYISFTNCPESLRDLANRRHLSSRRGPQRIVVVDPRIRFELGLPILDYEAEMRHYKVASPYRTNYWRNHFLYLWEVTPPEIVGIWNWDELQQSPNWYEDVVMRAVDAKRRAVVARQQGLRLRDRNLVADVDSSDEDIRPGICDDGSTSKGDDEAASGPESAGDNESASEDDSPAQLSNMLNDLKLGHPGSASLD